MAIAPPSRGCRTHRRLREDSTHAHTFQPAHTHTRCACRETVAFRSVCDSCIIVLHPAPCTHACLFSNGLQLFAGHPSTRFIPTNQKHFTMGGGNAQKSATARAKKAASAGKAGGGSNLKQQQSAQNIKCWTCYSTFMCTTYGLLPCHAISFLTATLYSCPPPLIATAHAHTSAALHMMPPTARVVFLFGLRLFISTVCTCEGNSPS